MRRPEYDSGTAPAPDAQAVLDRATSEGDLQQVVTDTARLYGWRVWHAWSAIHSAAGFPDVVLVKPPRVLFIELKSERGALTPAQLEWITALIGCPGIETFVWRPHDRDHIVRELSR